MYSHFAVNNCTVIIRNIILSQVIAIHYYTSGVSCILSNFNYEVQSLDHTHCTV